MNNLKKFFNKKKKSILSLVLALILTLSFNYSPLALLVDSFKSSAYKSSSVQTYYPNSSTKNETNISTGNYPSSLKDYFEGSSNNFNIEEYYNDRFDDLFAGYVDKYLKALEVKVGEPGTDDSFWTPYNTLYNEFLTSISYDTLLDYYIAEATNIKNNEKCETFREYVEYFVSHEISYQYVETGASSGTVKIIYPVTNFIYEENSNEYKIQFYNALANYLDPNTGAIKNEEIKDENDNIIGTAKDGITDQTKFYEQSISYNAVKTYIDNEIAETVAIYTYDNETQNKNVAGILADNAPGSKSYYYKDNSYESVSKTTEKYVTASGNTNPNVYYLAAKDASLTFIDDARGAEIDVDKTVVFDNDGSIKTNLEKYPLLYRPIESGEYGYVANYLTYYKFEAIPYQTLSDGNYQVYVLDTNGITPDEQAAYDFMYLDVITDASQLDSTYVNLPAPDGTETDTSYTIGLHDQYFIKVLGISPTSEDSSSTSTGDITRFKNIIKQFTDSNGKSTLYLKYKSTEYKYVYIQTEEAGTFEEKYSTYQYLKYLEPVDFESMSDLELEEYYEIDSSSFANYYKSDFKLYFKKIKANYETLTNIQYKEGQYETKEVPNIPFQTTKIASTSYEMDGNNKKIYVYIPTGQDSIDGIANLNQTTLESALHNEYVKVPETTVTELGLDSSHTYYYHHEIIENVKKLYIVVDSAKYNEEKDNEVYKNLNYTVIPSKQIDGVSDYYNYKDFITVEKSDSNYNENFKLYYRYDTTAENIYVKNIITGENALYVIDDSVTSSDKTTYKDGGRNFVVITPSEYESNHKFFTQLTSEDDFYNLKYTLYYKYNATNETERVIYENTTNKDSDYEIISTTDDDYAASDYELITPLLPNNEPNPDYVEGKNLYYKKIRDTENSSWYTQSPNLTTYHYSTNSTITFSSNSYYVISFYVYTNGTYNHDNGAGTTLSADMQASLYLEDSKGYITNAKVEHISTNGKWEKHYLYVATNSLSASSIKITMYMGDKTSIFGSQKETFFIGDTTEVYTIETDDVMKDTYSSANGTVLFDDIRVTKINLTDFNKLTIDDKEVQTTAPEEEPSEGEEEPTPANEEPATPEYVDKYGNKIVVTSINTNVNDSIVAWSGDESSSKTFEDNFNLDNLESFFSTLDFSNAHNIDGYSSLNDIWQMYISRDVSGQGNNYILKQYQKAYADGKLSASIIDESSFYDDKLPEDEEDDDVIDSDAPTDEEDDVKFIKSTFKNDNKVLKLTNTSRQLSLGLISNYFTVKQNEYYKLTVWVLATKEDVTANLMLSSVLKTATTLTHGTLITSTASVSANINDYTTTQANEYGWIPVSFYIEGNALHSQDCYLTLSADKDSTVYYDNITIEKITSGAYDTANSDSDKTTFCLSLTPSSSIISAGVTNGYFNNVTVTDNYNTDIDYTTPRKAESWTISETSTGIIAGVVPTSDEYLAYENFFSKYNSADPNVKVEIPTNLLKNNIYAIYAPSTIKNPLNSDSFNDENSYAHKSTYGIYSSSISLTASSTYKLSFEFFKGLNFNGTMFAEIYTSSVKEENLISTMEIDSDDISSDWNKYTFYIRTDSSTATVYIKIGVKNATGTCFFRNVSSVSTTETLDEIRDNLIASDENSEETTTDIFQKESFKNVRFIDLNAFEFSIHGNIKDETNTYETKEFNNSLANTSTFTTGDTAVAVASYYTSSVSKSYTVTIDKVEYYIKGSTVEGSTDLVYKMYSDSNYKEEVTNLNGKTVVVDGINKVTVGSENPTEYTITETETTNYVYNFKDDLTINNVFIDSSELKNNYSDKVLVLANSFSTDYTLATPVYNTTLSKTSYYVLKVYVKTSSFDDDFGLNIDLDSSISRKWTNIDTTDSKYNELRDENGFVCYQILISTNSSAISSFSIKFSLGTEKSTGAGYAIIAGIELKNFATEKLFNEYSLNYDDVDKNSNDTIIKSYFGAESTSDDSSSSDENGGSITTQDGSSKWATFFYIFSSLLLGIVLILALVATILKKHPIKVVKQEQNEHEKDLVQIATETTPTKKKRRTKKNQDEQNEQDEQIETEEVIKKDDGFV